MDNTNLEQDSVELYFSILENVKNGIFKLTYQERASLWEYYALYGDYCYLT